jgi:ParB-like chromosome segregation protein Spo0J
MKYPSVKIADIKVGKRVRNLNLIDPVKREFLLRSMKQFGLLQPVGLDEDNNLLYGELRVALAKELGWSDIPAVILAGAKNEGDRLRLERDENEARVELTLREKYELFKKLLPFEQEEARKRKRAGVKQPEFVLGEARERLANAVGVSRRTLDKLDEIVDAAKDHPDDPQRKEFLREALFSGHVDASWKRLREHEAEEGRQAKLAAQPEAERKSLDKRWPVLSGGYDSLKKLKDLQLVFCDLGADDTKVYADMLLGVIAKDAMVVTMLPETNWAKAAAAIDAMLPVVRHVTCVDMTQPKGSEIRLWAVSCAKPSSRMGNAVLYYHPEEDEPIPDHRSSGLLGRTLGALHRAGYTTVADVNTGGRIAAACLRLGFDCTTIEPTAEKAQKVRDKLALIAAAMKKEDEDMARTKEQIRKSQEKWQAEQEAAVKATKKAPAEPSTEVPTGAKAKVPA